MKLLLTSDVHGNYKNLEEVIKKHPDIAYHLDAGDMCLDHHILSKYQIRTVKGNCDFGSSAPKQIIIELDGLKVLIIHGHYQHVKFGLARLKLKAKLEGVNLCLFGHTHQRSLSVDNSIMFVNPGSLGDYHQSYAIYDNGQVTFYKLETKG